MAKVLCGVFACGKSTYGAVRARTLAGLRLNVCVLMVMRACVILDANHRNRAFFVSISNARTSRRSIRVLSKTLRCHYWYNWMRTLTIKITFYTFFLSFSSYTDLLSVHRKRQTTSNHWQLLLIARLGLAPAKRTWESIIINYAPDTLIRFYKCVCVYLQWPGKHICSYTRWGDSVRFG